MSREEKRHKVSVELINEMLKLGGHSITYEDLIDDTSEWYSRYTMTQEQNEAWTEWGIKLIKKKLKFNDKKARMEMAMFNLCYGLRIQNKNEDGKV